MIKSLNLTKVKSNSHWVKITKAIEFEIDYPTIEQELLLQEVMMNDTQDEGIRRIRYARLYLKYTIKNWRSTTPSFDKFKPLIKNDSGTEMEDGQWKGLIKDSVQLMDLMGIITEKLDFGEKDKKK